MVPVDVADVSRADVCDEDVGEEAAGSLLKALGEVPDPRKARGVRFPLGSILGLCVLAFVCGR